MCTRNCSFISHISASFDQVLIRRQQEGTVNKCSVVNERIVKKIRATVIKPFEAAASPRIPTDTIPWTNPQITKLNLNNFLGCRATVLFDRGRDRKSTNLYVQSNDLCRYLSVQRATFGHFELISNDSN